MNRIAQGTLALLTALLTTQALALEQEASRPTDVVIRSITYNGIGCPAGDSDFQAAYDIAGQGLVVRINQIIAEWGLGIPSFMSRKNCSLSIDLAGGEGWQYALSSFKMDGFVELDRDMKGEVRLTHFFDGGPSLTHTKVYDGPIKSEFKIQDPLPLSALQWSSCEARRNLNVVFAAKVAPGKPAPKPNTNAMGWLMIGSEWSSAGLDLGLIWRRCPA